MILKNVTIFISFCIGLSLAQQAPYINNVKALSDHSVQISWRNNSTQTKGFIVERGLSSSAFEFVGSTNKDATLFIDSALKPETKYYYRLKAVFESDTSDYSNIDSATTLKKDLHYNPVDSLSLSWDKITQSVTISFFDSSNCEKGWNIYESVNDGPFSQIGSFKSDEPEKTGSFSYERKGCAENTWYTFTVTTFSEQDSTTSKSFSIYTLNGKKFLDQMKKIHLVGKISDFPIIRHSQFIVLKNNGSFAVRDSGVGDSMLSIIDYSSVANPKFTGYKSFSRAVGVNTFYITMFDSSAIVCNLQSFSKKLYRINFQNGLLNSDSCTFKSICPNCQYIMAGSLRYFQLSLLNDNITILKEINFDGRSYVGVAIHSIKNTKDSVIVNGPLLGFKNDEILKTASGYVFMFPWIVKTDTAGQFAKIGALDEKSRQDFKAVDSAKIIKNFILDDSLISYTNFIDTIQKVIFFINNKSIEAYRYDYGPRVLKIRDNNYFESKNTGRVYSLKYKNQWLYIDAGSSLVTKVAIFSADGRCKSSINNIYVKAASNNCFHIGRINNGCYFVRITLKNGVSKNCKIIIQQ